MNHKLLPPLAALRAFEAVGRLGGVRKAGKELEIDHAVISRHIRTLESLIGKNLLVREPTGYQLTDDGQVYHQEIYKALTTIATATARLTETTERKKLRIWCIPGFASLWLSDRLGDFIKHHPSIDLDFRPADASPDFRSKEVDGDIRYLRRWEEAAVPKIVYKLEFARPLVFPVASPGYVANMKPLESVEELLSYTLLHEDNDLEWRHWLEAQGMTISDELPGPRLWHAHLTLNAARQDRGIVLANPMLLGDELADGRLVRVELAQGDFVPVRFGGYTLLAREDRWSTPALAIFRRWLRRTADAYEAGDFSQL